MDVSENDQSDATQIPGKHTRNRPPRQGLFHPARKVREVYWRHYNNLYIGSQDALTAFYPRMEDEGINTYARAEMDVFI